MKRSGAALRREGDSHRARPTRLTAKSLLPLVLLAIAFTTLTQPAFGQPAPQAPANLDLLAHGNQDRHDGLELFWLATVATDTRPGMLPAGTPPASATHFYALRSGGPAWQDWGEVPMRAVSLASRGSQLAALLEDGSWMLVSNDSTSTGSPVPVTGSELLTFADDGQTIWALAKLPGGVAHLRAITAALKAGSATRPATAASTGPAAATTSVAAMTAPAPAVAPTSAPTAPTSAPATANATATATATSAPARGPVIGPAPEVPLALLSFGSEGWSGEADLPGEMARPGDSVSLAFVAGDAYAAVRTLRSRGEVRLYRWADDNTREKKQGKTAGAPAPGRPKRWALAAVIPLSADARAIELLNGTPVPTLWVGGTTGPDLLYLLHAPSSAPSSAPATAPLNASLAESRGAAHAAGPLWTVPKPVELRGTQGAPAAGRTAAYAMGLIRSLYQHDGNLTQQAYDRITGAAVGGPTPVVLRAESVFLPSQWKYAVVAMAMLYVIGASFRRREQMRSMNVDPASLHLAPLGVRMLAGLIDALPVIVAWVYYANEIGAAELAGAVVGGGAASARAELVLAGAILFYLLHTTISEVLTGRTLGKVIFRLRVASLDGTTPTRGQYLTRNLLRVVDAALVFLPVLLVPLSPLRQRPGDTAAGTIVVTGTPEAEAVDGAPPGTLADGAAGATTAGGAVSPPPADEPDEPDEADED